MRPCVCWYELKLSGKPRLTTKSKSCGHRIYPSSSHPLDARRSLHSRAEPPIGVGRASDRLGPLLMWRTPRRPCIDLSDIYPDLFLLLFDSARRREPLNRIQGCQFRATTLEIRSNRVRLLIQRVPNHQRWSWLRPRSSALLHVIVPTQPARV